MTLVSTILLALFGGRIGDSILAALKDSPSRSTGRIESSTVSPTVGDPPLERTTEHLFTPAGPVFSYAIEKTVHGRCYEMSSQNPGNRQAHRCFTDEIAYDPCFSGTSAAGGLLCVDLPWPPESGQFIVTVFIPRGDPLPVVPPKEWQGRAINTDFPWALELEDGRKCRLGPKNVFYVGGAISTYACAHEVDSLRTQFIEELDGWIVGELNMESAVWEATYLSAISDINQTTSVRIRAAWR